MIVIKWIRSHSFILILVFVGLIISGFPLFKYGVGGAFYRSFDPDIVYITNTLSYTKNGIIYYADHPGTPTIMSLYYLYFPLRLLSKYVWHVNFIDWSFVNYSVINFYTRVFELILSAVSFLIFLNAVFKNSKSKITIFIAWLAVISFGELNFALSVSPENTLFFLTSVWVHWFIVSNKKRTYLISAILSLIAGFAVANKFTGLFLLVPAVFLPIFIRKLKFEQKIIRFEANVLLALGAFYIGILPAIERLTYIENWALALLFHSGIHATGTEALFDPQVYFHSLALVIKGMPFAFVFILSTIMLTIGLIIKKKLRASDPYILLLLTSVIGVFAFAKYSVLYYNFVNFLLIIFCASYFLSMSNLKIKLFFALLLLTPFILSLSQFAKVGTGQFQKDAEILSYANTYPPKKNVLWENNNMYQIISVWTHDWTADLFDEQFKKRPVIIISNDLTKVSISVGGKNIIKTPFDVCWDETFMLKDTALKFSELYKNQKLLLKPLGNKGDIYLVESAHCI